MLLFKNDCYEKKICDCDNDMSYPIASDGDFFYLKKNTTFKSIDLIRIKKCCNNYVEDYEVVKKVEPKMSSFIIRINKISNNSSFLSCLLCYDDIYDDIKAVSTNVITRYNFASDEDFILEIANQIKTKYGIDTFTINNNIIKFEFYKLTSYDCLCSNIYIKPSKSINDVGICKNYNTKYKFSLTNDVANCYNKTIFRNFHTLNTYNLCVDVLQQPECIEYTYDNIKILFPHKLYGCLQFVNMDNECSQPFNVLKGHISNVTKPFDDYYNSRTVCNTVWVQARNKNENWIAFRAPIFTYSPQFEFDQKVYKTSKGVLRKLYVSTEVQWSFETDYIDINYHKFIMECIEKDYVYIESFFYDNSISQVKRFISNSDYKIDFLDNYIGGGRLGKGTFTMKEDVYSYQNDFIL